MFFLKCATGLYNRPYRLRSLRASGLMFAALLWVGLASAQTLYKVSTPDGRVVYTDRPPTEGSARVEQLHSPRAEVTLPGLPASPAPVHDMPAAARGGTAPAQRLAPPPRTLTAALATQEMKELRECTRANQAALSLLKAAEDVILSADYLKAAGTGGAAPYRRELLDQQWLYYKSLGGTAVSPGEVRLPEDPCRQAREALQRRSAEMEAEYDQCVVSHPLEMRRMALSKELASGYRYLATLETIRQGGNPVPGIDRDRSDGGEFARAFKADPLQVRTELEVKFLEYRSAGGQATRLEDVRELPDPCLPKSDLPATPSPIRQQRTLIVPGK